MWISASGREARTHVERNGVDEGFDLGEVEKGPVLATARGIGGGSLPPCQWDEASIPENVLSATTTNFTSEAAPSDSIGAVGSGAGPAGRMVHCTNDEVFLFDKDLNTLSKILSAKHHPQFAF